MWHLIWNGFLQCVPKSHLGTCTCCPGDLDGFRVRAGSEAREEGQSPAPVLALYGEPEYGGSTLSPNLQCLEHPGMLLAPASLGVQGKEGQTHYITLCLFLFFFFFLAKVYRCGKCICSHPTLFNYVPERLFFFPKPCCIKWMLLHWTTKETPFSPPRKHRAACQPELILS